MGFAWLSHYLRTCPPAGKGRVSVLSGNGRHSSCCLLPLQCLWNAVILTTGCCLAAWGEGPAMVWVMAHVHCVTVSRVPNLSEAHRLTLSRGDM